MRIKITLLLVLSVLLVAYYWSEQTKTQGNQNQNVSPKISQVEVVKPVSKQLTENENSSQVSTNSPKQKAETMSDLELILQEIDIRMFSDDPYVELFSLDLVVGVCRDSFGLENLFQFAQGVVYEEQQKAVEAFQQQCKTYETQYPHLLSMTRKEQLADLKPQSQLGLLLEQKKRLSEMTEDERNELDAQLLSEAIRQGNSAVLVEVSFSYRFSKSLASGISNILNSKDYNYTGYMSQLALVKIACQFQQGRNCEANSALMLFVCSQQPESCSQDFHTWFEQNTLPGMKNDVETLIGIYQSSNQ